MTIHFYFHALLYIIIMLLFQQLTTSSAQQCGVSHIFIPVQSRDGQSISGSRDTRLCVVYAHPGTIPGWPEYLWTFRILCHSMASLDIPRKQCKGGKKMKQRLTVAFFVNATGKKETPIVIWKSENSRCLCRFDKSLLPVTYFSLPKA